VKLSVIIVSYNVKYFLEQCLCSLEKAAEGIEHEVIIVDNASDDDSTHYITSRFPGVKWIANKENLGFSRANNIAFEHVCGEYVLMLNPDTIVTRDSIASTVAFMDGNPEAGAVGVKMLNKDGNFALESRRGIVTPWVSICKAAGFCKRYPKSKLFGHYYMSYLPEDEVCSIEMVSGAFMMLRRSKLQEIGFLDEKFFMYWEDSDLSYRMLKSGAKNFYLPYPILHYKGESSVRSKLKYRYWLYYSLQIFFKKHNPLYYILSYMPLTLVVLLLKFRIHILNPLLLGKGWDARKVEPEQSFVVVGKRSTYDEIVDFFIKNNIGRYCTFVEACDADLANGNVKVTNPGGCNHVLFDTSCISYDTMVCTLESLKHEGLKIATYSPERKILITDGIIYNSNGVIEM
jgi:GT2 family glycosyltransferase